MCGRIWGLEQESANWLVGWLSAFVNKVLLEHSHTHLFAYYHCLFLGPIVELGSCERDYITHKVSNIYLLVLYRKSVLSPRQDIFLNQLFIFVMTNFILMIWKAQSTYKWNHSSFILKTPWEDIKWNLKLSIGQIHWDATYQSLNVERLELKFTCSVHEPVTSKLPATPSPAKKKKWKQHNQKNGHLSKDSVLHNT